VVSATVHFYGLRHTAAGIAAVSHLEVLGVLLSILRLAGDERHSTVAQLPEHLHRARKRLLCAAAALRRCPRHLRRRQLSKNVCDRRLASNRMRGLPGNGLNCRHT